MADILNDAEVLELPVSGYAAHLTVQRDDKAQTVRFLETNPFLYAILGQVVEQAQRYFDDAPLMLELVADPEDMGDQLLLTIDSPFSAEDAIQRFEQFRENWWLDALETADSKLSIALNYPVDDV